MSGFARIVMFVCMLQPTLALPTGCAPRFQFCPRYFLPVCAEGVTYENRCRAESAGYHSQCSTYITSGACVEQKTTCLSDEFMSESLDKCVKKPWADFESCDIEKAQGACANGNDPNPWVVQHCAKTCGHFVRIDTNRDM